jgi:DNA-binding LytR/AlgR family response regulator
MTPAISSALIIEDEPLIAQRLQRMCETLLPENCQIAHVETTRDALDWLDSHDAQIVFLDLNLKGQDGFDLLRTLSSYAAQTIVVSANTDRAIEAYEFGVADFVPKPFSQARLAKALDRLSAPASPDTAALKYVSFRFGRTVRTYPVSDIVCLAADDKYSQITLSDGETLFHDKPLGAFEGRLPEPFRRVHKSHIANLDRVKGFHAASGSRYWLEMEQERSVPVSRQQAPSLRAIFA